MRIESYNQINQIYSAEKANSIKQNAIKGKNDQLQISQTGLDYQIAKKAVANTNDVREELVDTLKAKVQADNYKVSDDDFVNKVMERYQKMMF